MFATVKSLVTPLLVCLIALSGSLPTPAIAARETPSEFILPWYQTPVRLNAGRNSPQ